MSFRWGRRVVLMSEGLHSNVDASQRVFRLSEEPPCWAAAPKEVLRWPNIAPPQELHPSQLLIMFFQSQGSASHFNCLLSVIGNVARQWQILHEVIKVNIYYLSSWLTEIRYPTKLGSGVKAASVVNKKIYIVTYSIVFTRIRIIFLPLAEIWQWNDRTSENMSPKMLKFSSVLLSKYQSAVQLKQSAVLKESAGKFHDIFLQKNNEKGWHEVLKLQFKLKWLNTLTYIQLYNVGTYKTQKSSCLSEF